MHGQADSEPLELREKRLVDQSADSVIAVVTTALSVGFAFELAVRARPFDSP